LNEELQAVSCKLQSKCTGHRRFDKVELSPDLKLTRRSDSEGEPIGNEFRA
jgi:hypothetical protein